VSLQSPFSLEVLENVEFVGVRAEALGVLGTMVADLFFNLWDLEVLPDCVIRYIPKCARYYSQSL
jgi:hypothetical protein